MWPALEKPQFGCDFRSPIPVTLNKLLKLSERQFVSSSAEESVGSSPWQCVCGDQLLGKFFTPFLVYRVRGRGWICRSSER